MYNKFRKTKRIILLIICFIIIALVSCSKYENIDILQNSYIINLNSNIVHKTNCQTVPKMSTKNKIISNEPIEDILLKGYAACKDCKPDRDAKFIVGEEINEFEKILHDEFGFGKDYTDKVLKLLSNLYEGIKARKRNNYESNKEYHRLLASTVYQNRKTWSLIAGHYSSKNEVISEFNKNYNCLKINDKSYFDDMSMNNLYDEVINQHDIKSGNDNDFAHMSATISVYNYESPIKVIAGAIAKEYNGISNIEVQTGFIGDICGVYGTKPSMNKDDYAADLDAVNLYNRYIANNKQTIYEIFIQYYNDLSNNVINRAEEFISNISIEKVMNYREYYSAYLQKDEKYNYSIDNSDYINRMNYYDNFVEHLTKLDQSFTPCKYFPYTEY